MTLKFVKVKKNVVLYQGEGLRGSVRFLTSQFKAAPPKELNVTDVDWAIGGAAPKVKESKYERKARLAAMSPEDKRQAALAKIAKDEARIAKRKAALEAAEAVPA